MFGQLTAIGQQVQNYSTGLGSVWYIIVFGFRLFVVSTIGGQVYGEEHGTFQCTVTLPGCQRQCFDQFAKMSHLRFWSFQIVAAMTPTVFFHLFVTHLQGQIKKIQVLESALKKLKEEEGADSEITAEIERQMKLLKKKESKVGKYKIKTVVRGSTKVEIPSCRRVMFANIINLGIRLVIEVSFIVFGSYLFNIQDGKRVEESSLSSYLWLRVPGIYKCDGSTQAARIACHQELHDNEHLTCHVARSYEKTFLLRYMNWMSVICVFLTGYEIVAVIVRSLRRRRPQRPAEDTERTGKLTAPDEVSLPTSSTSRANFRAPPSYKDDSTKQPRRTSSLFSFIHGAEVPLNTITNHQRAQLNHIEEAVDSRRTKRNGKVSASRR